MKVKGQTAINENVFLMAAQIVLQDMEDVVKPEKKGPLGGISKIFAEKSTAQILVKKLEPEKGGEFGRVAYELKLAVLYGTKIPVLVDEIRRRLTETIQEMTGYSVEKVDITVERIVEPGQMEEEQEEAEETEEA